jgi:hypothetical protein
MVNQLQWHADEEFDPPPDPSPQQPHHFNEAMRTTFPFSRPILK